jgi:hypothetical protein
MALKKGMYAMSYFREFKKYENSFLKKKIQRTQQLWRVLEFTNSTPPLPFGLHESSSLDF